MFQRVKDKYDKEIDPDKKVMYDNMIVKGTSTLDEVEKAQKDLSVSDQSKQVHVPQGQK